MASSSITFSIKVDPAREEALALADKYVTEWTEQTKNNRGYVHDKWTPVEVTTRVEAVLRVAEWLLTRPQLLSPPPTALETPPATIFGWHPGMGPPKESLYLAMIYHLAEIEKGDRPTPVVAIELLRQGIRMHEQGGSPPAVVHTAPHIDGQCPGPPECM